MPNSVATIKIDNEVDAYVLGLKPSEYNVLSDSFAIPAKNFWFTPKYKAKVWDGKIRFFARNGKTYVNLLPEIVPILKGLGYTLKLKDSRDKLSIKVPLIDKHYLQDFGWTLGDHQVDIVNTNIRHNGCMIKAGTGAGKTVCCWILHDLYYKHCGFETLIIVPTIDLIHQTVQEFKQFSDDVGLWGDSVKDTNHPVVVSTWQTLQKNESFVGKYKHIILDECHSGKDFASQINSILNKYAKNCYIKSGMTGTFPEDKAEFRTLEMALGKIEYEITARDLIDSGWNAELRLTLMQLNEDFHDKYAKYLEEWPNLVLEFKRNDPEYEIPDSPPTYAQFKKELFSEYTTETRYLEENTERNEFIASFVTSKTKSVGNSVVLVSHVKHGKALEKLIPGSVFIYGKDKTKKRKEMFDLFSNANDVIMITTFGLASIGLNIKRIFNIFAVDGGKSFIRVIQTIGRGLRKAPDKHKLNFYDVYGNLPYALKHKNDRVKFYKSEDHKINKTYKIDYR